ncbi:MAG: ABC transporter permease [Victivallales bacterium]|nr:ABC transporter permease [Victivallales bacterium]
MFTCLYQISKNTFREALREPIYLLVLISALCLIGLFPICSMFVFRAQEKLVIDSSMTTMMVLGWSVAVLIASYAVSREIDNGTALLLLSKPVQRPVFIIAKIIGILAAVTIFWFLTATATIITLRVAEDQFRFDTTMMSLYFGAILLSFAIAGAFNYANQASFGMSTVFSLAIILPLVALVGQFKPYKDAEVVTGLSWYIVPALVLILFSLLAMGALATTLSTRFGLVSNILLCLVFFIIGLMSDYILGRKAREPWSDSVPKGTQPLWMATYRFAPTERADIGKWERPVPIDESFPFTVWSSEDKSASILEKEDPKDLPQLGANPQKQWQNGQGWAVDPNDISGKILYMAQYDADNETKHWTVIKIANEAENVNRDSKDIEDSYDAYVFRRSGNPPRTPVGGNFLSPIPGGGSYMASFAYALVPNWQLFWMADAMAIKKAIPWAYVGYGFVYVTLFVILLMFFAIFLFGDREVGKQIVE